VLLLILRTTLLCNRPRSCCDHCLRKPLLLPCNWNCAQGTINTRYDLGTCPTGCCLATDLQRGTC
jgi:hypothetical protein